MMDYGQQDAKDQFQLKFNQNINQNTKIIIHENVSENVVCAMATILSRGRWV